MPMIPPIALAIIEVKEKRSAPNSTGTYPPIKEPMVMPVKTKNFLDMFKS